MMYLKKGMPASFTRIICQKIRMEPSELELTIQYMKRLALINTQQDFIMPDLSLRVNDIIASSVPQ